MYYVESACKIATLDIKREIKAFEGSAIFFLRNIVRNTVTNSKILIDCIVNIIVVMTLLL